MIELRELVDCYPLCDYKVGPLRMVTLKRYIHSSGNYIIYKEYLHILGKIPNLTNTRFNWHWAIWTKSIFTKYLTKTSIDNEIILILNI